MRNRDKSSKKSRYIRTHTVATCALVLAIIVFLGLSWQLYEYRGLMALVAEWEFDQFGTFFPLGTITALTLLVELPLIVVLISRSRAARTEYLLLEAPKVLIARSKLAYRELLIVSCGVLIGALALGIYGSTMEPTAASKLLNPSTASGSIPSGTSVQITGTLRLDRIALYKSNSLFFDRSLKVAPLQSAANQPIRYLVEIDTIQPMPAKDSTISGVAASSALPGPLINLYTNAGFKMARKPLLISTSIDAVRKPYIQTAWILAAIALLIFGLSMAVRYWHVVLQREFLAWKDLSEAKPALQ